MEIKEVIRIHEGCVDTAKNLTASNKEKYVDFEETIHKILEDFESGKLIEKIYCKDCKHSEPQDEHRVFCGLKGRQKNKKSFCEAMEK